MTAILKDLRSLKAARDRGEITSEQYARAEMVLHEMVEEAVIDVDTEPVVAPKRRTARPTPSSAPRSPAARPPNVATPAQAWETVLMVVAGLACVTMLFALLIGSVTLALTLLVTMIAAASIWALRHLDE